MHQPGNDRSASLLARMKVRWPWSLRVMVLFLPTLRIGRNRGADFVKPRLAFIENRPENVIIAR